MKLFELFNRPSSYEWKMKSRNYGQAIFVTSNATYKVIIGNEMFRHQPAWSIMFQALRMDADDWSVSNTGTGDEYEVFSTVVKIIREFLGEFGLRTIHMAPSDDARMKLYQRMLKRLLPTWRVAETSGQLFAIKPGESMPAWDGDEEEDDDFDRP